MLGFAIYLLVRFRVDVPRWFWLILLYLLAPLISLFLYGHDWHRGLWVWSQLALTVLSTLVVSLVGSDLLATDGRVVKILFGMWFTALSAYILRAGYFLVMGDFNPAAQVNGLHVSALFPLAVVLAYGRVPRALGYGVLTMAVLMIGDSRTEILMLLFSVSCILSFYFRRVLWLIVLFPVAVFLSIIYGFVERGFLLDFSGGLFDQLNFISSQRLTLWRMAFDHPPENVLMGVGVGQSPHYFKLFGYSYLSFHNAFLETWYDGGWLWLGLLLGGVFMFTRKLFSQYRYLTGEGRWTYSCYFGALGASIVACFLDRGYSTALFNVLMFYCLIVLYKYGEIHVRAPANPA